MEEEPELPFFFFFILVLIMFQREDVLMQDCFYFVIVKRYEGSHSHGETNSLFEGYDETRCFHTKKTDSGFLESPLLIGSRRTEETNKVFGFGLSASGSWRK